MRVKGDMPPGAYSIESQPGKPGFACVRLYENAEEVEAHWEYDEYRLTVPVRDDLPADVEAHYGDWLLTAKGMEHEQDALQQEAAANKLLRVTHEGAELAQASTEEPPATVGTLIAGFEKWAPGNFYEKKYSLFEHEGDVGFTRQDNITAMEHQPPFSPGMEAVYGIRPAPDDQGIYPYRYNMAASEGMKVRDAEGVVWYCYNPVDPLLWPPSEVAAHFRKEEN